MRPADFGKGVDSLYLYNSGTFGYSPNHNDNLKLEYNDEFLFSFERELFWNLAFDTAFTYRTMFTLGQEDINAIFEDGKFVGRIFPEYDIIWRRTAYTGDDQKYRYNSKTLQFALKRNFTTWGMMVNYSRFWRTFQRDAWEPLDPNQFVYSSPSDMDMFSYGIRWSFHGSASVRLPGDFLVSTFILGQSGKWMNDVTGDYGFYDSTPRVTLSNGRRVADPVWQAKNSYWVGKEFGLQGRYTDPEWRVNLRFQKGMNISNYRLEASIDFFNIFNWSTYGSWSSNDIRSDRYNTQLNPQAPRSAQINVRIEF
jgi:hypothetical protein